MVKKRQKIKMQFIQVTSEMFNTHTIVSIQSSNSYLGVVHMLLS